MRRSDFSDDSPGTLAPTLNDALAFIPAPLPPDLMLRAGLMRELDHAATAIGRLQGAWTDVANPQMLAQPFIHREAVLSSRIEGTQAGLGEVYLFELDPANEDRLADSREVANYVRALNAGLAIRDTLPIGKRFLCELHRTLLAGVRGQDRAPGHFRRLQNWLGPAHCLIEEARYVPPPPPQMMEALDAFERYLHADDDWPALIRLAMIHYQFEAIHPFIDGNGRIGRLLVTFLMHEWSVLSDPPLYLSAYFERHRRTYYDHLLAVSTHNDWEAWIGFFLDGVAEQADDAYQRARQLIALRERYANLVHHQPGSTRALWLLDNLFQRPYLNIPLAAKELEVTYHAARKQVEKLVGLGILREMTGRTRNKLYVADEIVRLIGSDAV